MRYVPLSVLVLLLGSMLVPLGTVDAASENYVGGQVPLVCAKARSPATGWIGVGGYCDFQVPGWATSAKVEIWNAGFAKVGGTVGVGGFYQKAFCDEGTTWTFPDFDIDRLRVTVNNGLDNYVNCGERIATGTWGKIYVTWE